MSNDYAKPRKRASGFQRTSISNALQFAFDDSQLDFAEFTERNEKAMRVTYVEELIPLVADLSLGPGLPTVNDEGYLSAVSQRFQQPIMPDQIDQIHQPPQPETTLSQQPPQTVSRPDLGSVAKNFLSSMMAPSTAQQLPTTYSIFSSVSRRGQWVCPAQHQVLTLFGSSDIDLTQAQFASMNTTIQLQAFFSEVTIIVPEEFRINNNVMAFLSENKYREDRRLLPASALDSQAPMLSIMGTALFSTVTIKRVRSRA